MEKTLHPKDFQYRLQKGTLPPFSSIVTRWCVRRAWSREQLRRRKWERPPWRRRPSSNARPWAPSSICFEQVKHTILIEYALIDWICSDWLNILWACKKYQTDWRKTYERTSLQCVKSQKSIHGIKWRTSLNIYLLSAMDVINNLFKIYLFKSALLS